MTPEMSMIMNIYKKGNVIIFEEFENMRMVDMCIRRHTTHLAYDAIRFEGFYHKDPKHLEAEVNSSDKIYTNVFCEEDDVDNYL
jgi:hypothetical protein